jgi:pyruvate/2-oxoglutarate dehydrogenase complex dihydrolipoamide acyltransferase (E2) component
MGKNVPGHFIRRPSLWRQISAIAWGSPNDPTIYGTLDVDATAVLRYVERLRAETGQHVTVTHVVVRALGLALRAHPECNAFLRFGKLYQREEVDIFVLVAQPPAAREAGREQRADLSGVRLARVDEQSVIEIARGLEEQKQELRGGRDQRVGPLKRYLTRPPQLIARLGLGLVTFLQYELNLDLSRLGIPRDTFGGALVTSMGMMGIKYAVPPLVPAMRHSIMLAVGRIEERPVVRDGAIVVRPIMPLAATLDHRIVDGYHASRLAETFTRLLEDPEGMGV